MRTTFIALVVLVLCTFATAQRLEVIGDSYSASNNMSNFALDVGLQWLENNTGITREGVRDHLGLLFAAALHYFFADFNIGIFDGEQLIPIIMAKLFGPDYIEKATDSPFRLKLD